MMMKTDAWQETGNVSVIRVTHNKHQVDKEKKNNGCNSCLL